MVGVALGGGNVTRMYPVVIEGADEQARTYSPKFQTDPEYASGWRSVLAKAHQGAVIRCSCLPRSDLLLSVRHYENDTFGLARFPYSGIKHHPNCRFFCLDGVETINYPRCGVKKTAGGKTVVRLQFSLVERDAGEGEVLPEKTVGPQQKPVSKKPVMRLGQLLKLLWSDANLNVWWPAMLGKRDSYLVNRKLDEAAQSITASKIALNSILLLAERHPDSVGAHRNQSRIASAIKNKHRMLMIAPLVNHSPERESELATTLKISGFQGIPVMDMPYGLWLNCQDRYRSAIEAWQRGTRVMVIAELDLKKDGRFANVMDLALMAVSDNWIPVDSIFEATIAEKLTTECRAFWKPLPTDPREDQLLPDFVLLDTGKDTPLEIVGRTDESYAVRKALKFSRYSKTLGVGGWWIWNAAFDPEGASICPFPGKLKKRDGLQENLESLSVLGA